MNDPSLETIFFSALEKTSADERAAYLGEVCSGDQELRRRVEKMLAAQSRGSSFLEQPAHSLVEAAETSLVSERPGSIIGPYTLLEQIGEGGFGVVFLAEQTEPVRRKVALKVVKPGMDTRQVVARFEAERQALAIMDHSNIARVFDGGATPSGRPFFVMELVRGVPITDFCDQHQLAPDERLRLFISVCQAVQHAHQKGIIHRDLKPSNILVTMSDGGAVPKVIDFGVAKATGQLLTDGTLFTGSDQFIGTPLYMSPEQAELSGTDIDTRSDIYSLGVILYELLTGSTPVRKEQLKQAAWDEVRRIIREADPPKPSSRLSAAGTTSHVAANRHTEPAKLTRLVRGELDWIVMKALEKDRSRRYESASGLGRDVEHYLRDEPVLACPPSRWYRLRKLAWRNRATFTAVSAVAFLLLLTVVTLAVSNTWIRREQARTDREKVRAEKAQKLAERHEEEIRQGLERLKSANALLDRGRWYAGEGRWDDAHEAFSQAIKLRPDHVSAWVDRGDLYTRLGLWDLAAADYAREIELREPDTTMRWFHLALLRHAVGDDEGCRRTARTMRQRFAGTLKVRFVEETVRSSLLTPDPTVDLPQLIELSRAAAPNQGWTMPYVIGAGLWRAGKLDEAIKQLEDALATKPLWPIGELSHPLLAMTHHTLGHDTEARQALKETARVFDGWTQARYADQGDSLSIHPGGAAIWPVAWWDYLECQVLYREAKTRIDGVPPPDDPRLHVLRARALAGLDRVEQAAAEFDAALKLSPHDRQIQLEAHRNRGRCGVKRREWRDAASEFSKATELNPDDATLWRFRAVAHFANGDTEGHTQTCLSMMERFAHTHDRLAAANVLLSCVLRDGAISDTSRLLELARVSDPLWHWGAGVRGAVLYRAGKYQESVHCLEAAAKTCRPRDWDWCFLAMANHRLGATDEARRCLNEAKRWIDAANYHTEDDPSGTQPVWGGWHEPVIGPLILREAEALLNGKL